MLTLKRYAPFHSLSLHVPKFDARFFFPFHPSHLSFRSFFRLTARQDSYIIGRRPSCRKHEGLVGCRK